MRRGVERQRPLFLCSSARHGIAQGAGQLVEDRGVQHRKAWMLSDCCSLRRWREIRRGCSGDAFALRRKRPPHHMRSHHRERFWSPVLPKRAWRIAGGQAPAMCKRATLGKGVFYIHICELCVYFVFAVLKILADNPNVAG